MDLTGFIYEQERHPQIISLLLRDGVVLSGRFATPDRPSMTIGVWKYSNVIVLKSVIIARVGGDVAKLPELIVPQSEVIAWGAGKLTPTSLHPAEPSSEK